MLYFLNCDIALYRGSCVRAAHSSNHHILASENDAESFDEILKPLQKFTTDFKTLDSATTCNDMDLMMILQ